MKGCSLTVALTVCSERLPGHTKSGNGRWTNCFFV